MVKAYTGCARRLRWLKVADAMIKANKRNFLEVSGDIVERVEPVFFSGPMTAGMKALGMI